MQTEHRGHLIRLIEGAPLRAVLIEGQTGVVLPTMLNAAANEGRDALASRARALIDLYIYGRTRPQRQLPTGIPPARPAGWEGVERRMAARSRPPLPAGGPATEG